jgi:predicted nucleic acid-binding protein
VTLFDTSVIIDARDPDSAWHEWAKERIAEAVAGDGAAANTVIVAEACVRAVNPEGVAVLLQELGMILLPLPISAALPAAIAFRTYLDRLKKEGKKSDGKVPLPDFLIGAHALVEGMKLVTRDPDRIRTYFSKVQMVVPRGSVS